MGEENKEIVLKESNTLALLGFIFSLTGCLTFVGLILSIIGLATAKKYKNDRKGFAIAGIVISSVLLIVSFGIYSSGIFNTPEDPSSSYSTTTNTSANTTNTTSNFNSKTTNNKDNNYGLGEKFVFDGFEITLDKTYSFVVLDNQFSELNGRTVIKIGANIKNISGSTGHINQFDISEFGSKGTELDGVDYYFDESISEAGDLRDGASYTKYFYLLYDGDGKYGIDFDDYSAKITVEFDVTQ